MPEHVILDKHREKVIWRDKITHEFKNKRRAVEYVQDKETLERELQESLELRQQPENDEILIIKPINEFR